MVAKNNWLAGRCACDQERPLQYVNIGSSAAEQSIEPRAAFHGLGLARLLVDRENNCLVFVGSQAGSFEADGFSR